METWHWIVLGGAAYLGVALALAQIDWQGLSGRAGVPIHAQSFRERWAVYGMPLPVIAILPLVMAGLFLTGLASDAVRLTRRVTGRQYDNETARTRKGWTLAEAMESPAPSVASAPATAAAMPQGTADASRGEMGTARAHSAAGR